MKISDIIGEENAVKLNVMLSNVDIREGHFWRQSFVWQGNIITAVVSDSLISLTEPTGNKYVYPRKLESPSWTLPRFTSEGLPVLVPTWEDLRRCMQELKDHWLTDGTAEFFDIKTNLGFERTRDGQFIITQPGSGARHEYSREEMKRALESQGNKIYFHKGVDYIQGYEPPVDNPLIFTEKALLYS